MKKETKGLKYIKQKKSNISSIIKFLDVLFSKKLIRKNTKKKIAKYKKRSLQLWNDVIKLSLTKKNKKISFISLI